MGNQSRLRTHNVAGRRLLLFVLLLCVIAAVFWYFVKERPGLWQQARFLLERTEYPSTSIQENIRGTIYDRNYKEFAVSYERVSVYANLREIKDLSGVVGLLSEIIGVSRNDLYNRIESGSLRTWLAKDINQLQEEEIRELDLPGIHLHREYVRYYPQQESAAHLIGFVEGESGLSGVEHYLNKLETRHRLEKGISNNSIRAGKASPGVDGRHLILTLDLKIQHILDRYLKQFSGIAPGTKVGALVMEAGSGSLIGYAQMPSYDPNNFHTYSAEVFSDIFDETLALPDPFKLFLRDVSLLESQSGQGYPSKSWSLAAEQRKLGIQLQLWDRLGAGSRGNPDFVSSHTPLSDRVAHDAPVLPERDYETVPVMQTPLQLLTAVTRIVNGGISVTPHAADRFVLRKNQNEYVLEDLKPAADKGLLNAGVSVEAREIFRVQAQPGPLGSSVLQGESTSYRMNGGMSSFKHHQVVMALVPTKVPELVLMIVMSTPGYMTEPRDAGILINEVMEIISPIVALQRVMKNLADMMSPGNTGNINYSGSANGSGAGQAGGGAGDKVQPKAVIKMPLLKDMSLRKSLRLLQSSGVEVEVRGTGRVVDQQPAAGTVLQRGGKIVLSLERDEVDAHFKKDSTTERQ